VLKIEHAVNGYENIFRYYENIFAIDSLLNIRLNILTMKHFYGILAVWICWICTGCSEKSNEVTITGRFDGVEDGPVMEKVF
jgi:hypothetical protein